MPVENANTIADLNELWPLSGDDVSAGDDHLRTIKNVLKKDVASLAYVLSALKTAFVGQVFFHAGTTAPTGSLICDGSEVPVEYADLRQMFSDDGNPYGVGVNGGPNVPDLRGEFIRGWDDGRSVDPGRSLGSFQNWQVGPHIHNYRISRAYDVDRDNGTSRIGRGQNAFVANNKSGDILSNGGTESRPRNIALLACIRAGVVSNV